MMTNARLVMSAALLLALAGVLPGCSGGSSAPAAPASTSTSSSTPIAPSSNTTLAVPVSNGIGGTLSLTTGSNWPSGVSATITTASSGAPAPLGAQRETLSASTQAAWQITFSGSTATLAAPSSPSLAFTGIPNPGASVLELFDTTAGGSPAVFTYSPTAAAYTTTAQFQITLGHIYYLEVVAGSSLGSSTSGTASCSTSGGTASTPVTGSMVGATGFTTPTLGGCSVTLNFANAFTNVTAGTYTATLYLPGASALAGLPAPSGNNPPLPNGYSASTFTPIMYLVIQLSGFVGTITENNPGGTFTVNALTNGTNFYNGNWNASAPGTTAPAVSATTFSSWSNNNNQNPGGFGSVPLTVTLPSPNQLSLAPYACTPSSSPNCEPQIATMPYSVTFVIAAGHF